LPELGIGAQQQVCQLLIPGMILESTLLQQHLLLAHQVLQTDGIPGEYGVRVGAIVVDQGGQIAVEVLIRRALKWHQAEVGLLQACIQPLVIEVDQTRYLNAGQ